MLSEMKINTPEEIGIKTSCVEEFLDSLKDDRVRLHGFVLMRNGKIGAEGYVKPFTKDTPHRMYSVTKSFVAIAIGLLIDEGKLSLDDKICKFFPDLVPDDVHPYIADATVRNLLMMSTMYSKSTYDINMTEWLKSYFTSQPDHPAGTMYFYDSCGSYVLGSIVKRVSGKNFDEYLDEKIFSKIGFAKGRRCLNGPDGERWAGSGLIITPRELAAFAQLLADNGKYNGEQLISESYVKEAVKRQVDNRNEGSDYAYHCGYGYQIWVLKNGAFYFNGMGGQMAIAFPDTGLVFACTADVQGAPCGKHCIIDAFWKKIVENLTDPMEIDEEASAKLRKRCENLEFLPYEGNAYSDTEKRIADKAFKLGKNPMEISDVKLSFSDGGGVFEYTTPRGKKKLEFGRMKFIESNFPETHYPGEQLGTSDGKMYRCMNSATWSDENTLVLNSYLIDDYVGNLTAVFAFNGDEIGVRMSSFAQFFLDEYKGFAGGKMTD